MKPYYSVKEAAFILGVSVSMMYKMIRLKIFTVHKFGDRTMISHEDLIAGAMKCREGAVTA
jgi:excisionase family DNA binding protein